METPTPPPDDVADLSEQHPPSADVVGPRVVDVPVVAGDAEAAVLAATITKVRAALPEQPARRMTVHRADGSATPAVADREAGVGGGNGNGGRPPMSVYATAPGRRPRRWPKLLAISGAVLAIAAIGVGGVAYWYLQDTVGAITHTSDKQQQVAQADLAIPLPDQPITALVIGEDRRPGEGPGRSDTMMLVRVDPRNQSMAMMSFPRDLVVNVPGYGRRSINEAYALGQEPLALATIKELTGISINYLVPLDFRAFQRIVGAFGGVYLPIDRRYYNKNDGSAANNFSEIDLQPGYQLLRGADALAFARYRHTDSDIVRMARQQAFVREFKKRIDAWGAASRIVELVSILRDNIKILASNKQEASARLLLDYGRLVASIPRQNMVQVRIDHTTPSSTNVGKLEASPQEIQETVNEFLRPDLKSGDAIASRDIAKDPSKRQEKPKYEAAMVPIEVRNGNGRPAAAADAAWQLVESGWLLAQSSGDSLVQILHTTVYYDDSMVGAKEAATAIASSFGSDSLVKPLDALARSEIEQSGVPIKQPVVVIVGGAYAGDLAPPPVPILPPKAEAQITRDPQRDLAMWRAAERKAKISLMMPTVLYSGARTRDPLFSSQPPYRVYKTGGHRAVYVTYSADSYDQVFGVQAIQWDDPPILDGPTTQRVVRGRTLLLYFNGSTLQRVAWKQNGISYWLENSLTGRIPNSAMIAMAKSFKTVAR